MIPKFWADLLSKQPTSAKPKEPGRSGMKSISEELDIRRRRLSQSSRLQHRSGESNQRHDNNNISPCNMGLGFQKLLSWICSTCGFCHWPNMSGNSRLMHCGIPFICCYNSPPRMCIFHMIVIMTLEISWSLFDNQVGCSCNQQGESINVHSIQYVSISICWEFSYIIERVGNSVGLRNHSLLTSMMTLCCCLLCIFLSIVNGETCFTIFVIQSNRDIWSA